MDVNITGVPVIMWPIVFGLGLLVANFFLRSVLIHLATVLCMVGVVVTADVESNVWIPLGAFMVMAYCVVDIAVKVNEWRS